METHRWGSDGRRYLTAECMQELTARVARQAPGCLPKIATNHGLRGTPSQCVREATSAGG
jgi:hypothetical protein